jgi:hypothetical protein
MTEEGGQGLPRERWEDHLLAVQGAMDEARLTESELNLVLSAEGRRAFRDLTSRRGGQKVTPLEVVEHVRMSQSEALIARVAALEHDSRDPDLAETITKLAKRVEAIEKGVRRRRRIGAGCIRATASITATTAFAAAVAAGRLHGAADVAAGAAALVALLVFAGFGRRVSGRAAAVIDTVVVTCLSLAADVAASRMLHATATDEVVVVSITVGVGSLAGTVYMLSHELRKPARPPS